jgi:translation elongation factor EF-Ts
MNPRTIEKAETLLDEKKVEKSSNEDRTGKSINDEESALYHQEFLAYPEFTVREVLAHVGWNIKGFLRFECGENLD